MKHDVRISTTTEPTTSTEALTHALLGFSGVRLPSAPARIALSGGCDRLVAALALWILERGHQLVLTPWMPSGSDVVHPLGSNIWLHVEEDSLARTAALPLRESAGGWRVAMYSSGSMGTARAYGFALDQLDTVASWYARIYRVTSASVIVTCLPTTYNFTFVAGLWLAACTGARLHLSRSPQVTFQDAARLAHETDRCVVLANPVLLQLADYTTRLPDNTLVDSGGAPLSAPVIAYLRHTLGDIREGYGLTETASLTHFDWEGTPASLGTVGQAMPYVHSAITDKDGKPRLVLESPAIGIELDEHGDGPARTSMLTSDLATIDSVGRLRLLGRADDCCIGGFWPRDTLDTIGPVMGIRCALVRHPTPDNVQVRVLGALTRPVDDQIRSVIADRVGVPDARISVAAASHNLLHSRKLPRAETIP